MRKVLVVVLLAGLLVLGLQSPAFPGQCRSRSHAGASDILWRSGTRR